MPQVLFRWGEESSSDGEKREFAMYGVLETIASLILDSH